MDWLPWLSVSIWLASYGVWLLPASSTGAGYALVVFGRVPVSVSVEIPGGQRRAEGGLGDDFDLAQRDPASEPPDHAIPEIGTAG